MMEQLKNYIICHVNDMRTPVMNDDDFNEIMYNIFDNMHKQYGEKVIRDMNTKEIYEIVSTELKKKYGKDNPKITIDILK